MPEPSGRIVGLVRELRARVVELEAGAPREAGGALRVIERLEAAVGLLERVAVDSFDEFEGRVRDLSLLRRLTDAMVSIFEVDRLCEAVLQIATEELGCDAGALYLTQGDDGLEYGSLFGTPPNGEREALFEHLAGVALEGLLPARRDDALEDSSLRGLADGAGLRSLLACPMATMGRPLGAIVVAHTRPRRLGPSEQRALGTFTDLAGLAIRHLSLTCEASERHTLESALDGPLQAFQRMRLELVRREKVAALAKLTAILAHEFNNPMSYVLSNLERAREYVDELSLHVGGVPVEEDASRMPIPLAEIASELSDMFDEMAEGLVRVRQVSQELHSVGRGSDEATTQVDVRLIAANALQIVRGHAKPGFRFEEQLGAVPLVLGRRLQLVQVLFHLLENAMEAAEDGVVRISTYRAGRSVRIEVRDEGPGIPEDRQERVFQPFYSTKPDGDGLGLSIVRDLVEGHGGEISVRCDPSGTVFTVSLPVPPDG